MVKLKKILIILLTIFLVVSFVVIIKNKIDLTKKEGWSIYIKSVFGFGKNFVVNVAKITSFAIKQEWIPSINITKR